MGNVHMEATQINYREGDKKMSVAEAIKNAGNTGLAHTADIAPDFSAESAYNAGDLVYHNGTLYVFTSNHSAGAWSTDDTQAVTVGGEITSLMSGLMNLHYHKIAESASTGTYAQKLQFLATAYNTLSFAQRRSALLVINTVDVYHSVNCSGNWFGVWVESSGAYLTRYGIDGSAYVETGGTVTDNSSLENANVFELWICEP